MHLIWREFSALLKSQVTGWGSVIGTTKFRNSKFMPTITLQTQKWSYSSIQSKGVVEEVDGNVLVLGIGVRIVVKDAARRSARISNMTGDHQQNLHIEHVLKHILRFSDWGIGGDFDQLQVAFGLGNCDEQRSADCKGSKLHVDL